MLKRWRNVKTLQPQMKKTLSEIPRSVSGYIPAKAELVDGRVEPHVVFVERDAAKKELIVYAGLLTGTNRRTPPLRIFYSFDDRYMVDLEEVTSVSASEFRLPVAIERKMEDHGQTHYAGWVVRFVLKDGVEFWHASSRERAWFASVPTGYSVEDIVDVVFPSAEEYAGLWEREKVLEDPRFKFCVFAPE